MNCNMQQADGWNAGCSALSWSTADGKHLWGRNYDFNRLADGTMITYVPRGTEYYTCGTSMEGSLRPETRRTAAYATVGTGFLLTSSNPILYEGINEKGLMGGQLYYRQFAHYPAQALPNTLPLQPPFAVYHLLAQCATVEEVVQTLQQQVTLIAVPLLGTVPPLHWSFSDATGEMIVVEPDETGLRIYRRTVGVMTNSPSYSWHRLNLLNYAGIRDLDYDCLTLGEEQLEQCFSGSGAQGLPGDWSSPSRFVRLAFLRQFGVKGRNEEEGVSHMLRLFESAAFPLGMVRVTHQGHVTQMDTDVQPFDYTVYTSLMCAESLRFYWTSYQNHRVQCVDLRNLMEKDTPVQFSMNREPDFLYHTCP
ncbi:MAG: linear amide C-N hydrolase [Eubacteriales bacterium]|jgi:penicillin V acylase-like amidase (Ntn superfamily)